MGEISTYVLLAAAGLMLVLQGLVLWLRSPKKPSALLTRLDQLERLQEKMEQTYRIERRSDREQAQVQAQGLRQEIAHILKGNADSTIKTLGEISANQLAQLQGFSMQLQNMMESNQKSLDGLKGVVETKLTALQQDNADRLEQMRKTVDEHLQGALEKRLGESFRLVSERLEQVYLGLGEMKTLASGVGDLKKVLTNIKVRGTWGEIQLGGILEQILGPNQYERNVMTSKGSNLRVEYAIRLPGKEPEQGDVVWLPIDAKFPKEDYDRLLEASEQGDAQRVEEAAGKLEQRVMLCAKEICEKYISPPNTTDFAIMFLPSEGLYAEVLRRVGLLETMQQKYRVSIAGPTTLAALLNSLQMGFRTLAIQKRSSEVWRVLGAIKTEFSKFGDVIVRVQKKLQEASHVVDSAAVRTRSITRSLRSVECIPSDEAEEMLGVSNFDKIEHPNGAKIPGDDKT